MPLRSPPPPADLRRFPARTLRPAHRLERIHRADSGPWFFAADGSGRFDLLDVPGQGTCYLAKEPLGAFVEVFRDTVLVDEVDVRARRHSTVAVGAPIRVADCAAKRARGFGVTAAIHATPDYALTQAWATALYHAGFGGVHYLLSHDPSQTLVGIALFGPAGPGAGNVVASRPIGRAVIAAAERDFGIKVRPAP